LYPVIQRIILESVAQIWKNKEFYIFHRHRTTHKRRNVFAFNS